MRRDSYIRPVGRGQDDDSCVALKAVHLSQQLVDGLLALVIASAHPSATLPADGINLVDEHDAGSLRLSLRSSNASSSTDQQRLPQSAGMGTGLNPKP